MSPSKLLFRILFVSGVLLLESLAAQAPATGEFVLYIDRLELNGAEASLDSRTCATVLPDRTFVYERTLQDLGLPEKADFRVYKGELTEEQMQRLKTLLADRAIDEALKGPPIPGDASMTEGEFVEAYIPRENEVAVLQYSVAFGVVNKGRVHFYAQNKQALAPLMKFVKDVIEKNKGKSRKGEPAFCAPPAGKKRLKKPMISG